MPSFSSSSSEEDSNNSEGELGAIFTSDSDSSESSSVDDVDTQSVETSPVTRTAAERLTDLKAEAAKKRAEAKVNEQFAVLAPPARPEERSLPTPPARPGCAPPAPPARPDYTHQPGTGSMSVEESVAEDIWEYFEALGELTMEELKDECDSSDVACESLTTEAQIKVALMVARLQDNADHPDGGGGGGSGDHMTTRLAELEHLVEQLRNYGAAWQVKVKQSEDVLQEVCDERDGLRRELEDLREAKRTLEANVRAMRAQRPPDEGVPPQLELEPKTDTEPEPEPELGDGSITLASDALVRTNTPAAIGQIRELYGALLEKDPALAKAEQLLKLVTQSSQPKPARMAHPLEVLADASDTEPLHSFLPPIGLGSYIDQFCEVGFNTVKDVRESQDLESDIAFLSPRDVQRLRSASDVPRGFVEDVPLSEFFAAADVQLERILEHAGRLGYRYVSDLKHACVDGCAAIQDNLDGSTHVQVAAELRATLATAPADLDVWQYRHDDGTWKKCSDQAAMTKSYLSRTAVWRVPGTNRVVNFATMEQIRVDTKTSRAIRGTTQLGKVPGLPAQLINSLRQLKIDTNMLPPEEKRLDYALRQMALACEPANMLLVKSEKKLVKSAKHKRLFSVDVVAGTLTWKSPRDGKTRLVLSVLKELPDEAISLMERHKQDTRLAFEIDTLEEGGHVGRLWVVANSIFQKQEWLFALAMAAEAAEQHTVDAQSTHEAVSPHAKDKTHRSRREVENDRKAREALHKLQQDVADAGSRPGSKDTTIQLANSCMQQCNRHSGSAPMVAYCCEYLHSMADAGTDTASTKVGEHIASQKGIAELILTALAEHASSPAVQQHGMHLLQVLTRSCYTKTSKVARALTKDRRAQMVAEAVACALRDTRDEELIHQICETMHCLIKCHKELDGVSHENCKQIREVFGKQSGGIRAIIKAMKAYPESADVQRSSCRVLNQLCGPASRGGVDEIAELIRENRAVRVAEAALQRFALVDDRGVTEAAQRLIDRVPDGFDFRGSNDRQLYTILALKEKKDASAKSEPIPLAGKCAQLYVGERGLTVYATDQTKLWGVTYSQMASAVLKDGRLWLTLITSKQTAASGRVYKLKPAQKTELDEILQLLEGRIRVKAADLVMKKEKLVMQVAKQADEKLLAAERFRAERELSDLRKKHELAQLAVRKKQQVSQAQREQELSELRAKQAQELLDIQAESARKQTELARKQAERDAEAQRAGIAQAERDAAAQRAATAQAEREKAVECAKAEEALLQKRKEQQRLQEIEAEHQRLVASQPTWEYERRAVPQLDDYGHSTSSAKASMIKGHMMCLDNNGHPANIRREQGIKSEVIGQVNSGDMLAVIDARTVSEADRQLSDELERASLADRVRMLHVQCGHGGWITGTFAVPPNGWFTFEPSQQQELHAHYVQRSREFTMHESACNWSTDLMHMTQTTTKETIDSEYRTRRIRARVHSSDGAILEWPGLSAEVLAAKEETMQAQAERDAAKEDARKEKEQRQLAEAQRTEELQKAKEREIELAADLKRAKAAAAAGKSIIWECLVDRTWIAYNPQTTDALEDAFSSSSVFVRFTNRGHTYEANFTSTPMQQRNTKTNALREIRRTEQAVDKGQFDTPDHWQPQGGENCILVDVMPGTPEFRHVRDCMVATMPHADQQIMKVQRVQNIALWEFYSMQKRKLGKLNGKDPNEVTVWHGTRALDPRAIFLDKQDGFMMQHSNQGMWGTGLYFAKNASYSDTYSHRCGFGKKSFFLTKLLAGEEKRIMPNDPNLRFCPDKPGGGRYDTVTGETNGSKVYVVYENGRAYPEYLITYMQL
eukprot:COSAG02_NODE_479_length_21477_cov_49.737674_10_plen_1821_part_00